MISSAVTDGKGRRKSKGLEAAKDEGSDVDIIVESRIFSASGTADSLAEEANFNQRRYLFTRVGKSGFAIEIPFGDFRADLDTACRVAYLAAKMSTRSVFTTTSQARAYDKVAAAMPASVTG